MPDQMTESEQHETILKIMEAIPDEKRGNEDRTSAKASNISRHWIVNR